MLKKAFSNSFQQKQYVCILPLYQKTRASLILEAGDSPNPTGKDLMDLNPGFFHNQAAIAVTKSQFSACIPS